MAENDCNQRRFDSNPVEHVHPQQQGETVSLTYANARELNANFYIFVLRQRWAADMLSCGNVQSQRLVRLDAGKDDDFSLISAVSKLAKWPAAGNFSVADLFKYRINAVQIHLFWI